jgi:hypothetical protein
VQLRFPAPTPSETDCNVRLNAHYWQEIGLPGVGKTLTAESVAFMTGKPWFSIGVSDIGIDGDKVEANLQKVFDVAGTWEAILLL